MSDTKTGVSAATTDGGSAVVTGAESPAADPNAEFTSALREATAAKTKAAAPADEKKPDAEEPKDKGTGADEKKADPAETAGAADKSAGAETAASKPAAKSPNNADITVDWSKVKPALKAAYDAGSPETKEAIEATIITGLKRGQEVARLRKTVSQGNHRRSPASTSSRTAKSGADLKKVLTGPAMAALDKEAPEITAAFREVVGPIAAELENANNTLDAQAIADMNAEAKAQENALTDFHPDWETLTVSKPFSEWLNKAAPHVRDMVARNAVVSDQFPNGRIVDAQEAALVLTLFKETAGSDSAEGDESAPGAEKGTEGSHQPSPVEKKRDLQRQSARQPEIKSVPAGSGVDENDFAGNLRAATAAKARERARGMSA